MKPIDILHLYPNEMNTYGDFGNLLVLRKRLERHGYKPVVHYHHPGGELPKADLVLGGGGQDSAQADVQTDILKIGPALHKMAEAGVPMLMVCGTYQLFGNRFITFDGAEIKGIGIFDLETIGGAKRLVGNVKVESEFGTLYGFENHSGQTKLGNNQALLGKVLRGAGNNGRDKTEGARTRNVFGTYLHGPMLPNNPQFADELIRLAATNRYGSFKPATFDDSLAELARSQAGKRKY